LRKSRYPKRKRLLRESLVSLEEKVLHKTGRHPLDLVFGAASSTPPEVDRKLRLQPGLPRAISNGGKESRRLFAN
jgi:hypothetical protein